MARLLASTEIAEVAGGRGSPEIRAQEPIIVWRVDNSSVMVVDHVDLDTDKKLYDAEGAKAQLLLIS